MFQNARYDYRFFQKLFRLRAKDQPPISTDDIRPTSLAELLNFPPIPLADSPSRSQNAGDGQRPQHVKAKKSPWLERQLRKIHGLRERPTTHKRSKSREKSDRAKTREEVTGGGDRVAIANIPENDALRSSLHGPAEELPFSATNTIEEESIEQGPIEQQPTQQQPTQQQPIEQQHIEQNRVVVEVEDVVDNANEEGPAAGDEEGIEHDDSGIVPGKKTVLKMAVLTAFVAVLVHRLRR